MFRVIENENSVYVRIERMWEFRGSNIYIYINKSQQNVESSYFPRRRLHKIKW